MRAVVYGTEWKGLWSWHVSLDETLGTDLTYWSYRDPSIRVRREGEPLSFGRALEEAKRRNAGRNGRWPFPLGAVNEKVHDMDMDKLAERMSGRSLLAEEFVSMLGLGDPAAREEWTSLAQWSYLSGVIAYGTSVDAKRTLFGAKQAFCRRCGAAGKELRWTFCASCGETCPYCERCLSMGRARYCTPLLLGRADKKASGEEIQVDLPDLKLSPAQAAAAEVGVRFILSEGDRRIREFLIWAVTGAGKTEMIFPLIAAERSRGGRVLIATPRKDVVLELLPRLRGAFPAERVIGLYGGSEERWESAGITVATTHQLFRYEAAFDLVVLDEVDAFPYHGDPMLAFVARKACKPGAAFVMLSATPPPELQRAVRSGRLPCVKVPVRYHRHPLPVPALRGTGRLIALLRQSLERGAQAFVFVPQIARLAPELARLRHALAADCEPGRIEATSSQDPMREDKVRRLRAGDIRILLTTTILERGVTIPKADVIVLDADSRLFDAAALVQMAGRAGRSAADPNGRAAFLAKQRTRAQVRAVREIRAMNRLARKQGYLMDS